MAKKKNSNLGKVFYALALVLGVVAVAMLFVTAVKTPDTTVLGATVKGNTVSGMQLAFGYAEDEVARLGFSFMGLLPWILVLAGVVVTLLNTLGKKGSALFDFVAIATFIVAGVLFFLTPNFMVFADTIPGNLLKAMDWKLAVGSIVAAITSLLAGAVVLVKNLSKN